MRQCSLSPLKCLSISLYASTMISTPLFLASIHNGTLCQWTISQNIQRDPYSTTYTFPYLLMLLFPLGWCERLFYIYCTNREIKSTEKQARVLILGNYNKWFIILCIPCFVIFLCILRPSFYVWLCFQSVYFFRKKLQWQPFVVVSLMTFYFWYCGVMKNFLFMILIFFPRLQ